MENTRPIVRMKRSESFCAAHRLHNHKLTAEENAAIYGKCNNPNGHGHNYIVKVVLEGPIDDTAGMVYNLSDLKRHMQEVLDMVDHKHLDLDVDYFKKGVVSTTENVCIFFYEELKQRLPDHKMLKQVTVRETSKNSFTYCGQWS
ncbi:6-pyruvoyl tetrahydropterin synthase [Aphelenchoides avenae]|nr:6-pyruvoyl tetrahydropterin synthase [Aphelenchus avenae]